MTTYTDLFNRADDPTTIGTGWTERIAGNTLGILSNAAYPTASNAFCGATFDTTMGSDDVTIRMDLNANVGGTICSPFIYLGYDTSGHGVIAQFSAGGGNTQAIIGTPTTSGYDPGGTITTQAVGSFVINTAGDSVGVKVVGNVYTIQHLSGGVMTDTTIVWTDGGAVATRDSSHRLAGCGGQAFLGSYWPINSVSFTDTVSAGTTVTPGGASLVLTGSAPQLNTKLTPGGASLVLTGSAPQLNTKLTPGGASLVLTGSAPQLNTKLTPGGASLVLTGSTPTVITPVTPGGASLVLTGSPPIVTTAGHNITPVGATLTLTGSAPVVTTGINAMLAMF